MEINNTLGHKLKHYPTLTGYLICDCCGIILYKSTQYDALYISDLSNELQTKSGTNKLDITCNEVIIKNLLE